MLVATRTFMALLALLLCLSPVAFSQANTGSAQANANLASNSSQSLRSKTFYLGPPPGEGPTIVTASFHLQDINAVDDEEETFEFAGILTLKWQDSRQAFDPATAEVKEQIFQGDFQFNEISPAWYPQVALANESGLYETRSTLLRVLPDGSSTLVQTINAVAEVNLSMRRYPFDTQKLTAVFEILGFDTEEVLLQAAEDHLDSQQRTIHISQWEIKDIRTIVGEQPAPYAGKLGRTSTFTAVIEVQRQSLFMVRLVVVPLMMIVMLSWTVFWMDRASLGDRLNISFVGILTAVAYQIVVGDILPHISYVTLMNGFLNLSFLAMCATVVINLVVGSCDRRGRSNLGDIIDRRCRFLFPLSYFGSLLAISIVAFTFF